MKFRDGYWGLQKGTSLINRIETRDIRSSDDQVTVYSSAKKTRHRGDTLNAPLITTVFSSPTKNVIKVTSYRFKGRCPIGPTFSICEDADKTAVIRETEDSIRLVNEELSVFIDKTTNGEMVFFNNDKKLTSIIQKLSGHITKNDGSVYMSEQLSLGVGETIYGMGERFTAFVKNGQVVDIWNEDGGTSSEQAYKNIPFYLSSAGYGVFIADPGKVSIEVASEVVTSVQFSVPGEVLEYYIITGKTLKDVLANYTRLTGKPALPPPWSFGLWLTTSFTTDYDEKTVNSFVDEMQQRNIPLHVFHFDCFWMKEYQWVDFTWDDSKFPDPVGMISRLKSKGLHICVWINPYIAQKSKLFDEGMENGYLVRTTEGDVWQWDRWQAGMALVDFTNPKAVSWYQEKLKVLLDMGVDTFKTDFGERIPINVIYHDKSDAIKMHNYYTHLYNRSVFELLESERGKHEALLFARSATAGGQQFPVHWGGDCSATYESMAESLRGGLSLSCSGFGFWSHDIGGFEQTATPDLFKRWVAFGLLSSHSRLHGNESYRVPWNYDEEASLVLKHFVELKSTLMPYIFGQSCFTHQTGIPLMRPMILEFPDDLSCPYIDRQYMLGDSLLVAPIFSNTGEVSFYLPHGRWTNFLTGKIVHGGRWIIESHDYFTLPLMVKENSVLAVGSNNQKPDYEYEDDVTFHVFALDSIATAQIPNANGDIIASCTIEKTDKGYTVAYDGTTKPWNVLLRSVSNVNSTSEGSFISTDLGVLVSIPKGTTALEIIE
ncbi:MAG TPA: alpha-xylosidase [Lachnospiraceae bacterium]|nr:alpha-xylosidase [Lachnospiraceae bacterium]